MTSIWLFSDEIKKKKMNSRANKHVVVCEMYSAFFFPFMDFHERPPLSESPLDTPTNY